MLIRLWMCRLICSFVFRIEQKQVFSWRGSFISWKERRFSPSWNFTQSIVLLYSHTWCVVFEWWLVRNLQRKLLCDVTFPTKDTSLWCDLFPTKETSLWHDLLPTKDTSLWHDLLSTKETSLWCDLFPTKETSLWHDLFPVFQATRRR